MTPVPLEVAENWESAGVMTSSEPPPAHWTAAAPQGPQSQGPRTVLPHGQIVERTVLPREMKYSGRFYLTGSSRRPLVEPVAYCGP